MKKAASAGTAARKIRATGSHHNRHIWPGGARHKAMSAPAQGRSDHDAAKESNLPSRGLPGPASFEDWMGHQARAAPRPILVDPSASPTAFERRRDLRTSPLVRVRPGGGPEAEAVLDCALDAGVE